MILLLRAIRAKQGAPLKSSDHQKFVMESFQNQMVNVHLLSKIISDSQYIVFIQVLSYHVLL